MNRSALRLARAVSAGVVGRLPIEIVPGWLGRVHGISVPRNVIPNLTESPAGPANVKIILRLLRATLDLPGDIAECGVFRGASLIPIALYIKQQRIPKTVFGFDSFEGFDSSVTIDIELGGQDDAEKRVGGFGETSYEELIEKIARLRLEPHVQVIRGYFNKTLSECRERRFSFVHLDCDIFQSYWDCLQFFYPRMTRGAIALFDEYNDPPWPGCKKAVDEFLRNRFEKPLEITMDNYRKWFIRKQ